MHGTLYVILLLGKSNNIQLEIYSMMNDEPHGLCRINEVIDHILQNIDVLIKILGYEDKH